jgi:hypothetical protein
VLKKINSAEMIFHFSKKFDYSWILKKMRSSFTPLRFDLQEVIGDNNNVTKIVSVPAQLVTGKLMNHDVLMLPVLAELALMFLPPSLLLHPVFHYEFPALSSSSWPYVYVSAHPQICSVLNKIFRSLLGMLLRVPVILYIDPSCCSYVSLPVLVFSFPLSVFND